MSWLVNRAHPDVIFTRRRAVVFADGVAITDDDGWMHITMPLQAVREGAPCVVSVRVRHEYDVNGDFVVEAREIFADGKIYRNVADLLGWFPMWAEEVGPALHFRIQSRDRKVVEAVNN